MNHSANQPTSNTSRLRKTLFVIIAIIFAVALSVGAAVIAIIALSDSSASNYDPECNPLYDECIVPVDKPIIYLYPEQTTELTVTLGHPELLMASYPQYTTEWEVTAEPDGTLTDHATGRELYALYWEGRAQDIEYDNLDGFVVRGSNTASFLEEKLTLLGLNAKETEEFIIYWLPKLQNNPYNFINFASLEEIEEYMPLDFSVEPDSLIRILMRYTPLDEYIEVNEQQLSTPKRTGFVAVEWGGTQIVLSNSSK